MKPSKSYFHESMSQGHSSYYKCGMISANLIEINIDQRNLKSKNLQQINFLKRISTYVYVCILEAAPESGFADFDNADFGTAPFVQNNFADFDNFQPPRSSSPQKDEAKKEVKDQIKDEKMDTDSSQTDTKVQRKKLFINIIILFKQQPDSLSIFLKIYKLKKTGRYPK